MPRHANPILSSVTALGASLLAACGTASGQGPDLDWLEGRWMSTDGDPQIEEYWTDSAGGLLLGVNRTRVGERAVAFEFLRIELSDDGARYCAQPGGRSASCFALTNQGATEARFENPDHDFPQVIHYRREGDRLTATISDLDGTQSMQFVWQRQAD